ncbi:orexin receptor type 2-like isoform X1 [Odontomachus brunneus]|uniref:orexin receptor type 2-like isoform X1 n=1 Tax=Odontomachus brunneus TaxID=486640 RepID=UPI0013F26D08|nr:orexin receptor type 2-like isoform X1 [Odontomachus brunneus]XP_032665481.1 orexin receptor type 2-like isoform X1 [Odontomachus brunneus]XP_032665491.1 orexin receptor type 2-like isoform X1 [Odontomachus brunneus]XP_032665499.1 orexin receptor type 2-like isoform X1 [Odontomachus brunneus]XP_032665506.1 orexin receptor type 2-like isoform X1 [Odontomachus brunneus]XP_032665514.1 orexin receptor type 2-like isoform X1 [Odontomachus brunneus]
MNLAVSTIAVWLASVTPRLSYAVDDADYYSSDRFEYANLTNCTNDYCISDEDYLELMVEHIFPKLPDWVLIAMHSVVFVVGLIGNALVCMAVYRNHSMRTVTNYFIVNLAVADLLVLLICLPPSVLWDVTETWFLGLKLCKAVPYLQTVSVSVSVLTLTFISIDRWYAICFPLRFKSTTGRAKTAIIIIWLIALLFDIPELLVLHTVPSNSRVETILFTQCVWSWSQESQTTFTIVKLILLYTGPLLFMSVAYWQIVRVLWRSDIPGHNLSTRVCHSNEIPLSGGGNPEGQLRSRRKAAKMLVAVVLTFAICFFPVHLLSILRSTIALPSNQWTIAVSLIAHWLCYFNSAVNPVIYNFMSGKFRKEFKRTFRCFPNSRTCAYKHGYVTGVLDPLKQRSRTNTRSIHTMSNNNNVQQSTEVIPLSAIINMPQNEKLG